MIQTIVSREGWIYFSERLSKNKSLVWEHSNEPIKEFNPFIEDYYNDFLVIRLLIENDRCCIYDSRSLDLYKEKVMSNEKFIELCYNKCNTKHKHFCTYVLKKEWKDFIGLLDNVTNGKEFIIGKRRMFCKQTGMDICNRNRAGYFNYFSPFNKMKWYLIGELNIPNQTPDGIFIHYELDGEEEKLYITKSIDSFTDDNRKNTLEFLNEICKIK